MCEGLWCVRDYDMRDYDMPRNCDVRDYDMRDYDM